MTTTRSFLYLFIVFLLAQLSPRLAVGQYVWEKAKLETLCLYNESGKNPVTEFTIRTRGGGPTPYMKWRRTGNTSREVVYECIDCPFNYFIVANAPVFNAALASVLGLNYSREVNEPNSYISYFGSTGNNEDLAEFTYVRRQGYWIPQLTLRKRWRDEVEAKLSATRFCRQNKPTVNYIVESDLGFRPGSIRINGKDYTSRYNPESGLELWEENGSSDVLFNLTDERGYPLNFRIKVDESGDRARCPSVAVNEVKLLRSLGRKADTAIPVVRVKGVFKGLEEETLKNADRPGLKYWVVPRSGELRFTLYAVPSELAQGLLFRDQYNSLTVSTASLSPAQKSQITAPLPRRPWYELSSRNGTSLERGDTLFILLNRDWLWRSQDLTIRFTPASDFPIASLRVNDTPIPGTDFSLPVSENGKTLKIELEDSLGTRLEKRVVLQIRDEEEGLAVTILTADSVYRRYLGEGFQAGSNFRQPPPGLQRFYLENTLVDLTRPFSFSYRLLPGTGSRPSLVFKKPGKIDYFSIVFRNDTALFYQQYEDGSTPTLLDSMPFDYRSAQDITCSRQNNLLLEGETSRRDWLLLNGRAFRNVNPASLWSDSSAQVGLGFPEPSNQYRFAQISLSRHRVTMSGENQETYTDIELLNRFFTGEKGDGVRTRALFETSSRNSFAILVANSNFIAPSSGGDPQPPLPAAGIVIDSLKNVLCNRYQFDSSHVRVLRDIEIKDLADLFDHLSTPDEFRRFFGLNPEPGFNLADVQLLIAMASHGTPDGKIVLSDGRSRNLKSDDYLRSLLVRTGEEARGIFRSLLYVEDICYGTFSQGASSPLVTGTSSGKETLSELYRQGLYDPETPSYCLHAASYNLGNLSVNLNGMRAFVNALLRLEVNADYYTDLDITRASIGETALPAMLLRPFSLEGNNARQDGRFLLLPRDHYKHLPE